VAQEEMMVVEDMTKDPRFKDNPFVTGDLHVRFYAGAPLVPPDGIHNGALCVIDTEPKSFSAA
jgi:GAF domain-containing protein